MFLPAFHFNKNNSEHEIWISVTKSQLDIDLDLDWATLGDAFSLQVLLKGWYYVLSST